MLYNILSAGKYTVNANKFIYASFDLCAIILSVVVLVNFLTSKKIDSRNNRLFLGLIISSIASAAVNFAAILVMVVINSPVWLGNLFTTLFYLTYGLTGVMFIVYVVALIYEYSVIPKVYYIVANVVCVFAIGGAVFASVCLFRYGYSAVPANLKWLYEGIVYGVQLVAFVFSFVLALINRKKLTATGKMNIYVFSGVNIVAILIQYFARIQLSNFALALAILLIYVTLQRPEDSIDATSGAFNAHTFNRRGNHLISANKEFYVFALEINNMTMVNSSFGLNGGNQVIREAADRLKKLLGKNEYLYRLSGVRFAVMFESPERYQKFAAVYPQVFEKPVSVNETELFLTAIACVIKFPDVTDKLSEVEDLIRYYRTSVNVSEEIIVADVSALEKARRRELVDYAIQNAINNGTFEVYYQPIFCVKDNAFSGCEALIRLKDETLGFISPDEFIPIAEQNGKIIEVGRFVIEDVCRFIKNHNLQQRGITFVDINLSVIQCMHPEIIADIENTLAKYQVPRSMVNLEITETASAQSYALLQNKLNELHSNGFTISLDDFGTGFASVEYLINFPFDVVKLDKSLVWAYMSTHKYEPILQHYMPMLHSLGTRIVAEGVETREMVDALVALGCDYLQGYYYSRPVPADKFLEFIENNSGEGQQLA